MPNQVVKQAVVTDQEDIKPSQTTMKIALFNSDGTPFEPGGSEDLESRLQAIEDELDAQDARITALENAGD